MRSFLIVVYSLGNRMYQSLPPTREMCHNSEGLHKIAYREIPVI